MIIQQYRNRAKELRNASRQRANWSVVKGRDGDDIEGQVDKNS